MMKDVSPFFARRARVLERIGDGVAIIPTAPERVRSRDATYPFRPDSYFWYLTGFPEPEAVLVLAAGRSLLFCREKDEARETWEGTRHGPKAAAPAFGLDEAHAIDTLEARLPELLADRPELWFSLGADAEWDARIIRALNHLRGQGRAGKRPPAQIRDLRQILDTMRLIKDKSELALMRRAADISAAGHLRAMRAARPERHEYELEAELGHTFRMMGASGHAYAPIVASGENACTLHYDRNDQPLPKGALVLIDAGCELAGYAADISRTFPVDGRFSAAQRACHEIVLAAQAAAIAATAPGTPFDAPHEAAVRVLVQGMIDLGLLKGSVDGLIASRAHERFYMHRTGHWLGLDTHDAGDYREGEAWTRLAPGMTLTVEPGLYIRPAPDVPEALRGIGIRIEDDVLVTPTGCEVYTHAPKSVAEIEEAMRHD
jgi:Xaa-Pro aminopeptidase